MNDCEAYYLLFKNENDNGKMVFSVCVYIKNNFFLCVASVGNKVSGRVNITTNCIL